MSAGLDTHAERHATAEVAPAVSGAATAIRVEGLVKSYDGIEAVAGIDFEVRTGEVFGLLGPNGAGKTTTVEILEGYRPRDAGAVEVLGVDPWGPTLPIASRLASCSSTRSFRLRSRCARSTGCSPATTKSRATPRR